MRRKKKMGRKRGKENDEDKEVVSRKEEWEKEEEKGNA